jgi:hypothetical protein
MNSASLHFKPAASPVQVEYPANRNASIFWIKELLEKGAHVASHVGSLFSSFLHNFFQKKTRSFWRPGLIIEAYYASYRLNHGRFLSLLLLLPAVHPAPAGTYQ